MHQRQKQGGEEKNKNKGKYIIISVSFQLTKNEHNLNISYGAIENELLLKRYKYNFLGLSYGVPIG